MKYTAPKIISPFYNYSRIPRKLKKKIHLDRKYLDINQLLWWYLEFTNPNYKRFLLNELANKYQ